MNSVKQILLSVVQALFGASWKTSLAGYLGGVIVYSQQYFGGQVGFGWTVVAAVIALIGRLAKDHNVTGGSVPNAP